MFFPCVVATLDSKDRGSLGKWKTLSVGSAEHKTPVPTPNCRPFRQNSREFYQLPLWTLPPFRPILVHLEGKAWGWRCPYSYRCFLIWDLFLLRPPLYNIKQYSSSWVSVTAILWVFPEPLFSFFSFLYRDFITSLILDSSHTVNPPIKPPGGLSYFRPIWGRGLNREGGLT